MTEPLPDRSLGEGAAVAHAGKDLPAPPGSPLAASWETKALFILSQATKETGKILNFNTGETAPATPLLSPFLGLAGTSLLRDRRLFTSAL